MSRNGADRQTDRQTDATERITTAYPLMMIRKISLKTLITTRNLKNTPRVHDRSMQSMVEKYEKVHFGLKLNSRKG